MLQIPHTSSIAHDGSLCALILASVVCLYQIANAQPKQPIDERQRPTANAAGVWPYAGQPAYPSGRFVITPDDEGRMAFDPGLAYSFQRALTASGADKGSLPYQIA